MYLVKELPPSERPREKLEIKGPEMLSNYELLAIIIQSGTKEKSALTLAQEIINQYDSLSQIKNISLDELLRFKGIGKAKAVQIMAAIEFGKRVNTSLLERGMQIKSPNDCAMYIHEEVKDLVQEHFICIYLDTKNRVLKKKTLFVGSLTRSIVAPIDIFREALKYGCAAIILVHNHRATCS